MKTIETFNGSTANNFEQYAWELAGAYKIAFAGDPWNERSRCDAMTCEKGFCELTAGAPCPTCGSQLIEAYDENELVEGWLTMLKDEGAFMEVAMQNDIAYLATLVRPTTTQELYERKYSDVPQMQDWIKNTLPNGDFIWIEDTFANRDVQPNKNLVDRGATLGRIALQYGGLQIATRTLSPAVIAATVRDAGPVTSLYLGEEEIKMKKGLQVESSGTVPDARSFLKIDGMKLI